MGQSLKPQESLTNQENDVLSASDSPWPSHSRPCLTHQAREGALPHLHASCLQRVHWPGGQPQLRSWTWPDCCLRTGLWLCQCCPFDPDQAWPCVHWISCLFSGPSHWPPCWPSSWAPGWPVHWWPPALPCWRPVSPPAPTPAAALPSHPVPRLSLPWTWTQDCEQLSLNNCTNDL